MRQRLTGDNGIRRFLLFQVKPPGLVTALNSEVRRLDKGPGEISIAILAIVFALLFTVAFPPAIDAAAIRSVIAWSLETVDIAGFQQYHLGQDITDARCRFQAFETNHGVDLGQDRFLES